MSSPNIVRVLDLWNDNKGKFYQAMEFCEKGSLYDFIALHKNGLTEKVAI